MAHVALLTVANGRDFVARDLTESDPGVPPFRHARGG
jgi:hypothetical protein